VSVKKKLNINDYLIDEEKVDSSNDQNQSIKESQDLTLITEVSPENLAPTTKPKPKPKTKAKPRTKPKIKVEEKEETETSPVEKPKRKRRATPKKEKSPIENMDPAQFIQHMLQNPEMRELVEKELNKTKPQPVQVLESLTAEKSRKEESPTSPKNQTTHMITDLKLKEEKPLLTEINKTENKSKFDPRIESTQEEIKKNRQEDDIKELYYRVREHNELFKLGTLFYKDIEYRLKSFAMSSVNADPEKEKTILGLAAYFSYHLKNRVTVITTSFHDGYYNSIGKEFNSHNINLYDERLNLIGYSCTGLTIIEFDQLHGLAIKYGSEVYQNIINFLIEDNELIFWDLPKEEVLQEQSELFFPIISKIDNVSIVVKPNISKQSDINNAKDFYDKYHLPIKGLIMAPEEKKKKVFK